MTKNALATAIVTIALTAPTRSSAQAEGILGGVATGQVISHISSELRSVIGRAEAAGDFVTMRGGQEALYVLDGFKAANTELLNTAFEKLGKERQAVINQIQRTTSDLEAGRVDTLERLEGLSNQMDTLVRDATFKKHPTIYRYRGSLVIPGETQPVRLRIQGYRLTHGTPYLLFRSKRYSGQPNENDLIFELPRTIFSAKPRDLTSESATLVLQKEPNWFWQSPSEVRTSLNVVTLPSQLANVTIEYRKDEPKHNELAYAREENHNSSSRSWDCKSFSYSPATAERRFDVTRSSVSEGNGNSRGYIEAVSVRDVGISFRICAKRRLHNRDNGFRHAHVRYVETWTTNEPKTVTESKLLTWTQNATFRGLPASGQGLLITVSDFTGQKPELPASGGRAGKYANVKFDAQSEVVVVSPIIPNDVRAL